MIEQQTPVETPKAEAIRRRSWIIALSSFFFILLQSACSAVMAVSGLRLLIGIGSLAAAGSGIRLLAAIHGAALRIPMEIFAVAGSVVNLYVVWRIRSLRARSSSQWRAASATPVNRRPETIQIVLAILTLLLVVAEWIGHLVEHGTI